MANIETTTVPVTVNNGPDLEVYLQYRNIKYEIVEWECVPGEITIHVPVTFVPGTGIHAEFKTRWAVWELANDYHQWREWKQSIKNNQP